MSIIEEKEKEKDIDIEEFTENLKHLRRAAGWTQEELAKKVGVTRQTITAIENNKKIPSITLILAILGIFLFASSMNPIIKSVSEAVNIDKIFQKVHNK